MWVPNIIAMAINNKTEYGTKQSMTVRLHAASLYIKSQHNNDAGHHPQQLIIQELIVLYYTGMYTSIHQLIRH